MGYTLYAGCSDYDIHSNCCTTLPTNNPNFDHINYSVTTRIPGEYLVNLLHNIHYDTAEDCTVLAKPHIFNLHDIPYDIGKNDVYQEFKQMEQDEKLSEELAALKQKVSGKQTVEQSTSAQ